MTDETWEVMTMNQPVIDSHWHLYICKDQQGKDFRTVMDEFQKEYGLAAMNICAIPVYNGLGPAQNILAALYKLHNPNAYAYAGLVYPVQPYRCPMPEGMDPLSQYEELMALGFDGIKMLETKPTEQKAYGMRIDDSYFDPMFAAAEADGTHMIWHVADPDTFWDINRIPQVFLDRGWFYGDGTYLSYEDTYQQVFNVLDKHPNLPVTFAHFFFYADKPEQLERVFAKYPGTSVDVTPGSEMYGAFRENREFYRDFFTRYADRILYGTDTSFNGGDMTRFGERGLTVRDFLSTDKDLTVIRVDTKGLALPEAVCEKILSGNFLRLAGATPKPVDKKALKAYVEKYKHLIGDKTLYDFIVNEVAIDD